MAFVPHVETEEGLRRRLGIPGDAARVLVFAESSHWDPNWVFTSETYWQRFVRRNLDLALDALAHEPRRIYSVECMFFLRLYWDRCPERRSEIRTLVNEGRLRLTGSGVTTADTLLPPVEALFRDWLIGQEWLRTLEMTQEPRLFYLTDSFGCSPCLPSLLNAAGFDRTALTRIDGMYFVGCDYESASHFPRPGSSAERLLVQERTLDFVWRDGHGGEVLSHWNAFTYGQGDMLAYRGLSRVYLVPWAWPDSSARNVTRRIGQIVDQLEPYRRTPYLFCPIGFDFVPPIPDLIGLLDRYNRVHYPDTGVWTVNAGLDDYLALIENYRQELPVLHLDPNPYWTGFYTARPTLKESCYRLVDALLLAERLSALSREPQTGSDAAAELAPAWWDAVTANHHDFITGTSPDAVVDEEQVPWLERATAQAEAAVERLAAETVGQEPPAGGESIAVPGWRREGTRIEVRTPDYVAVLDEAVGGALVEMRETRTGRLLLGRVANDLVIYKERGGLWRMGHEFAGGSFERVFRASDGHVALDTFVHGGALVVSSVFHLAGKTLHREVWFRNDSPVVRCRVEGQAADRHTVLVRLDTGLVTGEWVMDAPGGVVTRPLERIYKPTFWPLYSFVHLQDAAQGHGLVLCQRLPGAAACGEGVLDLVAIRNATRERAWGVVPIPGMPATGHERGIYSFDYAFWSTAQGDWQENAVAGLVHQLRTGPWRASRQAALYAQAAAAIVVDRDDVFVIACKPAQRGEGWIARLYAPAAPAGPVTLTRPGLPVRSAARCDVRERDIEPLAVHDGRAMLHMSGTAATVRLL